MDYGDVTPDTVRRFGFNRAQLVLIMVAVDADKTKRIKDALEANRAGNKSLSDKAWREAAELDVIWNRMREVKDNLS